MRIVFMGTPDFAVESLRQLVEGGYNVVGVVTNPDKPIGRHGNTIAPSPVKQYALSHHLPILQPEKFKDEHFLQQLAQWKADVQVVVAFRMLPEVVWSMPRMGTFNLHAALLPNYRGAAPINWAIINGEKETGVTTFLLDHDIDTGRILLQEKVAISACDNAGSIHDKLMSVGAALVRKTIDLLAQGDMQSVPQSQWPAPPVLHHAPKLFRDTCRIDWAQPCQRVHNFIRGLSPYPGAWTLLRDESHSQLKIFESHLLTNLPALPTTAEPGTLIGSSSGLQLYARCSDGWIELTHVQLAGKRRMSGSDFLRGYRL